MEVVDDLDLGIVAVRRLAHRGSRNTLIGQILLDGVRQWDPAVRNEYPRGDRASRFETFHTVLLVLQCIESGR